MPCPFSLSLTEVVRALPQTGRIVHGQTQPSTLRRFVGGELALGRHLAELFDAILDRSLTPEEQDQADAVVELIALEWHARKAARRGAPSPDLMAASLAEEDANHPLNRAQCALAPNAPLSVVHAVRDASLVQIARTRDLAHAAHAVIATAAVVGAC